MYATELFTKIIYLPHHHDPLYFLFFEYIIGEDQKF